MLELTPAQCLALSHMFSSAGINPSPINPMVKLYAEPAHAQNPYVKDAIIVEFPIGLKRIITPDGVVGDKI